MTESTVSEVVERLEADIAGCHDDDLLRDLDCKSSAGDLRTLLSTIKATGGGPSREEVARDVLSVMCRDLVARIERGDALTLMDIADARMGAEVAFSLGKEDQDYRPELPCADAGSDIPRSPRFGDLIENGWASAENPTRLGFFVREGHRTGRMNPGRYFEVTDGKGKFWELSNFGDHKITIRPGPLSEGAARDMGSRAPQGADDASGNTPKPVSQPDHAPGEGNMPPVLVQPIDTSGGQTTPQPQTEGGAA